MWLCVGFETTFSYAPRLAERRITFRRIGNTVNACFSGRPNRWQSFFCFFYDHDANVIYEGDFQRLLMAAMRIEARLESHSSPPRARGPFFLKLPLRSVRRRRERSASKAPYQILVWQRSRRPFLPFLKGRIWQSKSENFHYEPRQAPLRSSLPLGGVPNDSLGRKTGRWSACPPI